LCPAHLWTHLLLSGWSMETMIPFFVPSPAFSITLEFRWAWSPYSTQIRFEAGNKSDLWPHLGVGGPEHGAVLCQQLPFSVSPRPTPARVAPASGPWGAEGEGEGGEEEEVEGGEGGGPGAPRLGGWRASWLPGGRGWSHLHSCNLGWRLFEIHNSDFIESPNAICVLPWVRSLMEWRGETRRAAGGRRARGGRIPGPQVAVGSTVRRVCKHVQRSFRHRTAEHRAPHWHRTAPAGGQQAKKGSHTEDDRLQYRNMKIYVTNTSLICSQI
jgi:hypothetical protein